MLFPQLSGRIRAVLAVGLLSAQAKPNFSGTWALVSSTDSPGNVAQKPVVAVITQNDTTLTLKNGDRTLVWQLDGSESTIKVTRPTGPEDLKFRARWDGERLIVEQRTTTTSIIQTVSLSDDGTELTVETVAQGPKGETRGTQVFKKS